MAVEYEYIIQKMINELQHAKLEHSNHTKMKRHIAKVQALSELVLDENPTTIDTEDHITEQEIKAMLGQEKTKVNNHQPSKPDNKGNDGSIFDF